MSEDASNPRHGGLTDAGLARRFAVAWIFLFVSGVLGAGLRLAVIQPVPGFHYGHMLHAHSHVAFLGWVFNAFFVAALRQFIPPDRARSYDAVWWTMQVAIVGMLVTFPIQGYDVASIAFTTLHMGAAIVFAGKLWRTNHAVPAARFFLRAGLLFMLVSGLGPVALGPLAALDLRDSPAYSLSIYFYLHFQYNGWFLFFLLALLLQLRHGRGRAADSAAAIRAGWWLIAGCGLTYALSALWCDPPSWVRGVALAGGAAQLIGCVLLVRSVRAAPAGTALRPALLWVVAVASFFLKYVLQFLGAWPGLAELANQRFVAIAFLHLIFLGVVTPALLLWAGHAGWVREGWPRRAGLVLFLGGALVTEVMLVAPTGFALAGWSFPLPLAPTLFAAALALVAGIALLGLALRPARRVRGEA